MTLAQQREGTRYMQLLTLAPDIQDAAKPAPSSVTTEAFWDGRNTY